MLDAFGHSSGISHLYAEMGMTETVFSRMNYDEVYDREENGNADFIMQPKFAFDDPDTESKNIFAHLVFDHYTPPGFVKRDLLHDTILKEYNKFETG